MHPSFFNLSLIMLFSGEQDQSGWFSRKWESRFHGCQGNQIEGRCQHKQIVDNTRESHFCPGWSGKFVDLCFLLFASVNLHVFFNLKLTDLLLDDIFQEGFNYRIYSSSELFTKLLQNFIFWEMKSCSLWIWLDKDCGLVCGLCINHW